MFFILSPPKTISKAPINADKLFLNPLINPNISKPISFPRASTKVPLNYYLLGMLEPEGISCKYLGIILRSDLSWADQVNCTVKKAWKALHFTLRILRKGTNNTKSLATGHQFDRLWNVGLRVGIRIEKGRYGSWTGCKGKPPSLPII